MKYKIFFSITLLFFGFFFFNLFYLFIVFPLIFVTLRFSKFIINFFDYYFFFHFVNLFIFFFLFFFILMFYYYYCKINYFSKISNNLNSSNFDFKTTNNNYKINIKNFFYYYFIKINKNKDEKSSNFLLTDDFISKIGNFNYALVVDNDFFNFRHNIYFSKFDDFKKILILLWSISEFLFLLLLLYKLFLLYYKFDFLMIFLNFDESFLPYNRLNLKGFIDFSSFIIICFIFSCLLFSFYLWIYENLDEEFETNEQDFWMYNSFIPHVRVLFYIFIFILLISFTGLSFFNLVFFCGFQIFSIFKEFILNIFSFSVNLLEGIEKIYDIGFFSPFYYLKIFNNVFFNNYKNSINNHLNLSLLFEQELWKYELLIDFRKKNRFILDNKDLVFYNELINKNFFGFGLKLDGRYLYLNSPITIQKKTQYFRTTGEILFDPLYNPILKKNENGFFLSFFPEINIENLRFENLELSDFYDYARINNDYYFDDSYDSLNFYKISPRLVDFDFNFNNLNLKSKSSNFFFKIKDYFSNFWDFLEFKKEIDTENMEFWFYRDHGMRPDFKTTNLSYVQYSSIPVNRKNPKLNFYNFFTNFKKNLILNKYWYEDFFFFYTNNESFFNSDNYFFNSYDFLNICKDNDYFLVNNFFFKPFFFYKKLDSIFVHFNWLDTNEIVSDYFLFTDTDDVEDDHSDISIDTINMSFFDFLNDFYNEQFFVDENDAVVFDLYDEETDSIIFSEDINENYDTDYELKKIVNFLPNENEMQDSDSVPMTDSLEETHGDFFFITGELGDIETILGINIFFDINKFLNIYSVNDFVFTDQYRDDIIYSNNFGVKLNFNIIVNYDNFYLDIFNSYYTLESKIQNFIFFQNTMMERYVYKYFGASIVTEGLRYELMESNLKGDFQKLILFPSFKRNNSVFFQQLYNFNWRNFKEKFIEFPYTDYVFPYKKYKFFGIDKLFFDWKNDGTILKNHNSDYSNQFLDYLDDQEIVYFLEFPQTHFYHRDLTRSFMLADYNSSLILKDYQNGLFYDKKNYFLNNYLFNLLLYNIDLSLNSFIDNYFVILKDNKMLYETPLGAGTIIFPFISQNDIFFVKRTLSDNYFRTNSIELSFIFERLNIKLMDFINRLIFLDFEKRGNIFINDLLTNVNFFDFIRIFNLLKGYDPWNLYKINSIFDLNQLDLMLNDQKLFNFLDDEVEEDELRNTQSHFLFRKFNFHILDNIDFVLFPYRNHYIFPSKFFFIKSDLGNFLEIQGISKIFKLKHLNDINVLNKFDLILFLKNFLDEDEDEDLVFLSHDEILFDEFDDFEAIEDAWDKIEENLDYLDDPSLIRYNKKKKFEKFIISSDYDLINSKNSFKFKKKKLFKELNDFNSIKYKTFAPRFEIGFPNNRNFFRSLIFRSFTDILFKDPYLFGLYNFPYDNAYSYFWVNFVRSTFLKNQFISQIRNDRIFSSNFFLDGLVYKRISFSYGLETIKGSFQKRFFLYNFLYKKGIIGYNAFPILEQYFSLKHELFYPIVNWFFFDEWKKSRFRKYNFSYFKNFRIFFDSSKKISIFFDRRGNVSFSRFPSKLSKLGTEYESIYFPGHDSKEFGKSLVKYPDFFNFNGFFLFIQNFFSFFIDKLNITKYLIFIVNSYSFFNFSFLKFNIKNASATYEIILYKRRQRYARFLSFMQDNFITQDVYTTQPVHDFDVFYIFYSMENLTRNFNTILSQISAMNVRSYHFRYIINKIKPSPELIIFRNNDIRLKKIINQIYFFKGLSNRTYNFGINNFWLYFFKSNYIDTRLFNLPFDFFLIEKYPKSFYIFDPINEVSLNYRVRFYDNLDCLTRFNYHKKSVKHSFFDYRIFLVQRSYKWTYFGFDYYGYMYNDINFYRKIFAFNYFRYKNFYVYEVPYFNHFKSFKIAPNVLFYNNEFVNVTPLGYLRTKNLFHFTFKGNDMFFGVINPNYNVSFENYYKSIAIYKYIIKKVVFNNNLTNLLTIYTPFEYEIYKKEKFLNWLKFNRYRRILKHYNLYFSNYLYFSNFHLVSDMFDYSYHSPRDFLNHNFISDYFAEQGDEETDDRFIQSRNRFYIPYKHEYWYFNYPDKVFFAQYNFLRQYFDVLYYYEHEIFEQTLKIIDLKIKYDIYKINEVANIIDILYIYNLKDCESLKEFNSSFFQNKKKFSYITYYLIYLFLIFNYLDFELHNCTLFNFYYLIVISFNNFYLYSSINIINFFIVKMLYFFYKFCMYFFFKFYYYCFVFEIFDKNLFNNEYFKFLDYSFLFFWIHCYLFPCWVIFFFFLSSFANTHLQVEPRVINPIKYNTHYKILNEFDVDMNDKMYFKDFVVYKISYSNELNDFLLTYKRHPTLFELEKLLNKANLKTKKLSFSSTEEPFLKDKTFLMDPVISNDNLLIFYAYRREPIVGSFIFYKFFQHKQLERSLRIFVQKKYFENRKFTDFNSFVLLDDSFIPTRTYEGLTKEEIQIIKEDQSKPTKFFMQFKLRKKRKKIFKRLFIKYKFKKIIKKFKQKKLNMWYNTLTTPSHKNVFTFFGFLYKSSIIYFEFFFFVYLSCVIFVNFF